MLPSTTGRVILNTPEEVRRRIQRRAWEQVEQATLGGVASIDRRLAALEREWDIERTLEANAASVAVAGCLLGFTVDRRFFALPALAGAFLLQHALQGWCPPLPLLRRLGIRTAGEIEEERSALRATRAQLAGGSRHSR
jgi:hypothetical protein